MNFSNQFSLLLWKNYKLQLRKVCITLFEIVLPIFFAGILLAIRSTSSSDVIDSSTTWRPVQIDQIGAVDSNATQILYSPNKTVINEVFDKLRLASVNITVRGFATEEDLLYFYQYGESEDALGAIVFDNIDDDAVLPKLLKYSVRPHAARIGSSWDTNFIYPLVQSTAPRNNISSGGSPFYLREGFLFMQQAVGRALIQQLNGSVNLNSLQVLLQKLPYPPYTSDPFINIIQTQLPFFLILSFLLNALQITRNIVYEKEQKLKESMKMMGLSNFVLWLSWFVKCFIYLFIAMGFYTIILSVVIPDHGSILGNTNPFLFFLFLLCFGISIIATSFAISTFFDSANSATAVAGCVFFLSYLPNFFIASSYETMTRSQKLATCILPNMAMAFGVKIFGLKLGTGEGIDFSNAHLPATVDDDLTLVDTILFLLGMSMLLFLVTWYVDAVRPGESGIPQPFYFPFLPSYWCGRTEKPLSDEDSLNTQPKTEFFEMEPLDLKPGISIRNLSKTFGSGGKKNKAVAGMSLNIYEGQITALLGHNGAGKTTAMSMLTGFIPPSGGTAIVNGHDIRVDIAGVRRSMGLCPQHNILYDLLTVEEHLKFFAQLKGCMDRNKLKADIRQILKEVDLEDKRKVRAGLLSGGQKRKLSIALALIGDSKIIILDEPTSGMDPDARRKVWDLLQRYRGLRTIVLTTHFMDEADILGDRIAIMAEGVVKCCGSSLFLKNRYGAGYHLIVVRDHNTNVDRVSRLIQSHVPLARLESDVGAELSYILPHEEKSKFEALFGDLESGQKDKSLGILGFGASVTTMEEVFLRVGENAETDTALTKSPVHKADLRNLYTDNRTPEAPQIVIQDRNEEENSFLKKSPSNGTEMTNLGHSVTLPDFNSDLDKNTGSALLAQRFWAALVKKVIHTWRNRVVSFVQLLLPVLFTITGLAVASISQATAEEKSISLDLSGFDVNQIIGYSSGLAPQNITKGLAEAYAKQLSYAAELVNRNTYQFMSEYYLNKSEKIGNAAFNQRVIVGADFQTPTPIPGVSVMATSYFNGQPFHSTAISLSYTLKAMLSYFTNDEYNMEVNNNPLPMKPSESIDSVSTQFSGTGLSVAINVIFGMSILATTFVLFLIKERNTSAKHLQVASGLNIPLFWLANFLWDFANYCIPVLVMMIVFAAYQTEAYVYDGRLGYVFILFFLYGWAVLPFMYSLQFLFHTPSTGMVLLTMLNIISGLATIITVFVMAIPSLELTDVSDILDWVFIILLPNYALGKALMDLYVNHGTLALCEGMDYKSLCSFGVPTPCCKDTCGENCFAFQEDYLSWEYPGIGRSLVFLALQGLVFFLVVALVESQIFLSIFYKFRPYRSSSVGADHEATVTQCDDQDVVKERERINSIAFTGLEADALILKNMTKYYKQLVAVDHLSLGIPKAECFGLLGVNGAGKTATFKMLTGQEIISEGNAYLCGYDIKSDLRKVQQNFGYCPQFDSLIDQMTGRETLTMYARLRGINESRIKHVIESLIKLLLLEDHADKQTKKFSGGNRRKLSTAIALIGDPPVIFLDEPSSGMDPAARRQLWSVISQVRASGRTIILSSHSMEECDALCTRMAIMVNGEFKCLGSSQYLKNKFGMGYTVIVKLGILEDGQVAPLEPLIKFMESRFPGAEQIDVHQGYVHYQIPEVDITLGQIFGIMEDARDAYGIEDYSVGQTTLEQIFLNFARAQRTEKSKQPRKCFGCCCCA